MNYNKETLQFASSNGVDTICASLWIPEKKPKAVVQICHGMCEYVDRYDPFALFLLQQGYLVCGTDHLGHGRSAVGKERLGFFSDQNGDRHLVDDQHLLRLLVTRRYPDLPYFLFGHSMGSFITRNYISVYGEGLSGYLCCGTSGKNPAVGLALALSSHLIKTKGPDYRSQRLQDLAFKNYNSRYKQENHLFSWITRDSEIRDRYQQDPYCNFIFTVSGFHDLFSLLSSVSSQQWADSVNKSLPIFLLSGDMDPVGNYGKGVRQVYGWLKESGIYDLSLRLYPGARHELLNETNRQEVYLDILSWLEGHLHHRGGNP